MLSELGFELVQPVIARNRMRRCANNIHVELGASISLNDGRRLNCNIYRPIKGEDVLVIMCMGAFGNAFINGFLSEADPILYERADDYFSDAYNSLETQRILKGIFLKRMLPCVLANLSAPDAKGKRPTLISPSQRTNFMKLAGKMVIDPLLKGKKPLIPIKAPAIVPVSSSFEEPSFEFWVPNGYAVIHVEECGQGNNCDADFKQFGTQNAKDYGEQRQVLHDEAPRRVGKCFARRNSGSEALACTLENGQIAGAAIDTIYPEPPNKDHPLLNLSPSAQARLLLTPHTAGTTDEAFARMLEWAIQNFKRVANGETPINIVNTWSK